MMSRSRLAHILSWLLLTPLLLQPGCKLAEQDAVGRRNVEVSGHIERAVFPGPPNYESVAAGDEPLPCWVLSADQPLTGMGVCGFSHPLTPAEASRLQLVLEAAQYQRFAGLLGREVVVRGICFWAHAGGHGTPLLIEVQDIRLRGGK